MKTKQILSSDENFIYMGRRELTEDGAVELSNPYTMVTINFTGTSAGIRIKNRKIYWDNYLGYVIDGIQKKIKIEVHGEQIVLPLCSGLKKDALHELTIFKRMDGCHVLTFYALILEEDAEVSRPKPLPDRRIEVYGDSVSAGEVSEAVEYTGRQDPEHNGEYSNSWYSYAAIAARKLQAQLHNVSQGGLALLNNTGWFHAPDYLGLESTWDLTSYTQDVTVARWDFTNYMPHVVIIAVGQNDSHPEDIMQIDYNGDKAVHWRKEYRKFVQTIRKVYPNALIILSTTLLYHHAGWDQAIGQVCGELDDPKVVQFLYKRNGCGTPGHLRIGEAEEMAEELCTFIAGYGDELWMNESI